MAKEKAGHNTVDVSPRKPTGVKKETKVIESKGKGK